MSLDSDRSHIEGNFNFVDNGAPWIKIIKCNYPGYTKFDTCYKGVRDCLDQILANGDIPGYKIHGYVSDFVLSCSNRYNSANNYLDSTRLSGDNGCFLFVTDCTYSNAHVGGAWNNRRLAFISAPSHSGEKLGSTAAQEAFHPYIASSCNEVDQMLGGENGTHDLGTKVTENNDYWRTAMCSTYPDSADVGDCQEPWVSANGARNNVSDCTSDAIRLFWEHYNGGGH